jgi:hypothetical protein
MGNRLTSLPADVDDFLESLAQMIEVEDDSINYTDIQKYADRATKVDIRKLRGQMADLADLDFDFEDPEAIAITLNIINEVKDVQYA